MSSERRRRPSPMSKVTSHIGISVDGYVAGPDQSRDTPLGEGGEHLHEWMFGDVHEIDAPFVEAIVAGNGAYVMGRNMFASGRGEWDLDWRGWWGDDPPYHAPVFVLTHYEREPVEMEGGTTFHFVTDGFDAAFARAREAAGDLDVSIAGGASTVNQAIAAGVLEELHLHVAPILLGAGERLFDNAGTPKLEPVESTGSSRATHITYRVRK